MLPDKRPLVPQDLSVSDWLKFADRKRHFDADANPLRTHGRTDAEFGDVNCIGWQKEAWAINAVFLPIHEHTLELLDGIDDIGRHQAAHTSFDIGWAGNEFSFGNQQEFGGLTLEPWITTWRDPLSNEFHFEPRADFLRYHNLVRREANGVVTFRRPLEDLVVLSISTFVTRFDEVFLSAEVHRDYLRDYLAARRAILLIGAVSDRFVVTPLDEKTGIEDMLDEDIAEHVSLVPTLHETWHEGKLARVILYETTVVQPFARPNTERTLWYFSGKRLENDNVPLPTFLVDANQTRRPIAEVKATFLFFQLRVLELYLGSDGYSAFFHMRKWGSAAGPSRPSVACGVNENGVLTAFAYQIGALTRADQEHWARYSTAPDGKLCSELVQTQMQNNPPHSPGVIEIFDDCQNSLETSWNKRFKTRLFRDLTPAQAETQRRVRMRMSVGPLTSVDFESLGRLAKGLYENYIDTMSLDAIRKAAEKLGVAYDEKMRQLVILRKISAAILKRSEADVKPQYASLARVNELRVVAAHSTGNEVLSLARGFGIVAPSEEARSLWDAVVDASATSIATIAAILAQ